MEQPLALRIRVYTWVLLGILCGAAAALTIRFTFHWTPTAEDNDILANFLQVVGGIYGVVIGFVIFVVWGQFTDSEVVIDRETTGLRSISQLSSATQDQAYSRQIRKSISAYAQTVIDQESRIESFEELSTFNNPAWEELRAFIYRTPAEQPRDQVVLRQMFEQLDQLAEIRSLRMSCLSTRIPWLIWHLLIFVSMLVVVPACFLTMHSVVLHAVVVGLMVGTVVFFLIVVYDLDNPSKGVFNVSYAPYHHLIESI